MPEMRSVLPSFASRVFSQLKDGDYVTVRAGKSRTKAEMVERFGPDSREEDDTQRELDELFLSADGFGDALIDLVATLEGSGTVWVELFARGRKRPHDRAIVDQWPKDDAVGQPLGLERLTRLAGGDVSAAALSKAFDSRNMQIDGLLREVRQMAQDARQAGYREIEAARAAAIAEIDARIMEASGDGDAREARAERSHELLLALVAGVAPGLRPLVEAKLAGMGVNPKPTEPRAPSEPGTVDAEIDDLIARFTALVQRREGCEAIMGRQGEIMQLAQAAATQSQVVDPAP